jgi:serine/threonine-protein kinase
MATAYLARTLGEGGFERLVVLKRLNLELLGRAETLQRFLAEARVAARLHHVNVVGTHAVGRDAAGPFIVLDYVEGGTLDDLVERANQRGKRLPVPVVLRIVLDALAGLEAVHEARDTDGRRLDILHRDVTLQNLLVSVKDGVTRLADFGVAKSAIGFVNTAQGYFVGKLCYFPPEYLQREPVGPTLDLYALGVCMWLAITGRELWPEETEAQVVRAILDDGIPPLATCVEVAPAIQDLVAVACARDPRCRFQTAREMRAAIEALDRNCGWVASHGAIADTVKDFLGDDLERRRLRLSELTRRPSLVSSVQDRAFADTERLPPPPRLPSALPPIPSAAPASGKVSQRSARPTRLAVVGGAFAISAVLGAVVTVTSREERGPVRVTRPTVLPSRDAAVPAPATTPAAVSVGQAIPTEVLPSSNAQRKPLPAPKQAGTPLRRRNPYR